jgi:hypothetical protein
MNKKDQLSLSAADRSLLELIQARFDLAEQLVGGEPAIWNEFGCLPPEATIAESPLGQVRSNIFSGDPVQEPGGRKP